jgi:hypothetical protein
MRPAVSAVCHGLSGRSRRRGEAPSRGPHCHRSHSLDPVPVWCWYHRRCRGHSPDLPRRQRRSLGRGSRLRPGRCRVRRLLPPPRRHCWRRCRRRAGSLHALYGGQYDPVYVHVPTEQMQRSKCETNNFGRIATRSLPMPPTNLVLILYPLVSEYARAAPVGVREGTAQMVTPHVFIVVAMDRNACTPCKYHSQFAL